METFQVGERWHWRTFTGATSLVLGEPGWESEAEAVEAGKVADRRAACTVYEVTGGTEEDDREPGHYIDVHDPETGEIVRTEGPFEDDQEAATWIEDWVS